MVEQRVVLRWLRLVNHVGDACLESCILEWLLEDLLLHVADSLFHAYRLNFLRNRLRLVLVSNQGCQLLRVLFCSRLEVFAWSLKQILAEFGTYWFLDHQRFEFVPRLHCLISATLTSICLKLAQVFVRLNTNLLRVYCAELLRI